MSKKKKILVAVICFKRSDHLYKCLNAIQDSYLKDKHEVIIFQDYDENQSTEWKQSNTLINNFEFKTNINEENLGLRENIFSVLTFFHESNFSHLIMIEDDIVISENFFNYFDYTFDKFENCKDIFQISGFSPLKRGLSFYGFYPRISTWGWGTWKKKFPDPKKVKIDWGSFKLNKSEHEIYNKFMPDVIKLNQLQSHGKINTWSLDFLYFMVKNNLKTVYPGKSLVRNIGFDGSGENCGNNKPLISLKRFRFKDKSMINGLDKFEVPNKLIADSIMRNKFLKYYSPNILDRGIRKIFGLK